jgi:hypothetical protein
MEIATERVDNAVIVKAIGKFYSNDAQEVEDGLAGSLVAACPALRST